MKKSKLSLSKEIKSIDFKSNSPIFRISSNKSIALDTILTPKTAYLEILNENNQEKEQEITHFVINNGKNKIRLKINIYNKTSDWLLESLIKRIQQKNDYNEKIIGFSSKNFSLIDYILTQKNEKLFFLKDLTFEFDLFYKEVKYQPKYNLKHFAFIKIIGSGGFSKVYLARSKITGIFHAVKLIDKEFIKKHQKEGIVNNERKILGIIDNPYLIKLDYAFKTSRFLIFVMEFCAGGELFHHLRKSKSFSEENARLIFLEMCCGIKYLHERNIIYRDIKPENILVGIDGHIKIADFGLAKPEMNRIKKATSFCGSPEYMSPEMLMKCGHSYSVDLYCLGAILYEMVFGLPPFYTDNTNEMFENILTQPVCFPKDVYISENLKSLILGLLIKNPQYRIGQLAGIKEVLAHPWCRKIDWNSIIEKKNTAPLKINPFEFYFDKINEDKDLELFNELDKEKEDVKENDLIENFYFESKSSNSLEDDNNKKTNNKENSNNYFLHNNYGIYKNEKKNQLKKTYSIGFNDLSLFQKKEPFVNINKTNIKEILANNTKKKINIDTELQKNLNFYKSNISSTKNFEKKNEQFFFKKEISNLSNAYSFLNNNKNLSKSKIKKIDYSIRKDNLTIKSTDLQLNKEYFLKSNSKNIFLKELKT